MRAILRAGTPVLFVLIGGARAPVAAQSPEQPKKESVTSIQLQSRALVSGTPFVSWADAARMNYPNNDVTNPSWAASLAMLLQYWDRDLTFLGSSDTEVRAWGTLEARHAASLTELKSYAARGIPVMVDAALTPVAHPLTVTASVMASVQNFTIPEGGPYSGTLGRLASLETFQRLDRELFKGNFDPLSESMLKANRVFVGYDDDRRVVILQDPSFGPAWEVGYDDFDKMWAAMGRRYLFAVPHDTAAILQQRRVADSYRSRTPDEMAAEQYVMACGYLVADRLEEAHTLLEKGLDVRGVGTGYRHLLLTELALHLSTAHSAAPDQVERAIVLTEEAVSLVPDRAEPWTLLARLYRISSRPDRDRKAHDVDQKARKLASDRNALRRAGKILPHDFWMPGLRQGWGVE